MLNAEPQYKNHSPYFYAPTELATTAVRVKHALIIGGCFAEGISHHIHRVFAGASADHITYNFAGELPEPARPITDYAFQLIMLPLRAVMPEGMFMMLDWNDIQPYMDCLTHSKKILKTMLDGSLSYNGQHGLTSFVTDFLVPQASSVGRLQPRNDIRNPAAFVRELNAFVADYVQKRNNVHLLSIDDIAAQIGRRFIQNDIIMTNSDGAFVSDWDWSMDQDRLHPPQKLADVNEIKNADYILAIWTETAASYRTLMQQDSVKLVICGLDNTLWRGVVAEEGVDNPALIEGWPLGLIEALNYVRRRGILLAIASKNDESNIRRLWSDIIGNRLPLNKFAVVKINWHSRAENIGEIMRETSLLPRNVVFIDDNPVERETALKAHPGIRVLGADLYSIRRILLWAPEMQVAAITDEAGRRTDMIQTQIEREKTRTVMSRPEFLASLDIRLTRHKIDGVNHPKFARAIELLNKTNQFNTTGRRWQQEAIIGLFHRGGRIEVFSVQDKFTEYGLMGLALIDGDTIEQVVMSCSVLGLEVEIAFISDIVAAMLVNGAVHGKIKATDANILSRDLFERCGWSGSGDNWEIREASQPPVHVTMIAERELT